MTLLGRSERGYRKQIVPGPRGSALGGRNRQTRAPTLSACKTSEYTRPTPQQSPFEEQIRKVPALPGDF